MLRLIAPEAECAKRNSAECAKRNSAECAKRIRPSFGNVIFFHKHFHDEQYQSSEFSQLLHSFVRSYNFKRLHKRTTPGQASPPPAQRDRAWARSWGEKERSAAFFGRDFFSDAFFCFAGRAVFFGNCRASKLNNKKKNWAKHSSELSGVTLAKYFAKIKRAAYFRKIFSENRARTLFSHNILRKWGARPIFTKYFAAIRCAPYFREAFCENRVRALFSRNMFRISSYFPYFRLRHCAD